MIILQEKDIKELVLEMCFRKNEYDNNGDFVTFIQDINEGNYFEIDIWINSDKILSMLFDLDGFFVSLELRESERKKSVAILKRNYNGIFYIFPKNIHNLYNDKINYYLDYYNNHVVIDNDYARKIVEEVLGVIDYAIGMTNFEKYTQMLSKIRKHKIEDLFDSNFYKEQGYYTKLSVLPPNVRPDNNHNYMIVQMTSGCKILNQRKRACGFCDSFEMKYHELNIFELENHLKCLEEKNYCCVKQASCVFLADGDPLISENVLEKMLLIRKRFPNINAFESFISTNTILKIDSQTWKRLLELGLRKVYWGVESADKKTLNIIDKPHDPYMLNKARDILERFQVSYDIIIMSGIGCIGEKERTEKDVCENKHVQCTVEFVNESKCESVFISKLQLSPNCTMAKKINIELFPMTELEMELQYRSLIKKIIKYVRGSYGNQFVVESVEQRT